MSDPFVAPEGILSLNIGPWMNRSIQQLLMGDANEVFHDRMWSEISR